MRQNVIIGRAHLNKCTQQQGKSAEDYIKVLYQLADSCKYGNIKEEIIHLRGKRKFLVGTRDEAISKCLQMEFKFTLDKTKNLISKERH